MDPLSFIGTIRWQDVVDITVNSYIIFRLYILLRGTNAFRILIGFAFLWFFQTTAEALGLIITSWAIQGITAVAAIIIIVVFRNEIRSVLQVKNLKSILWGFSHKTTPTPIEAIVDSAFELARKRMGALLVFPGQKDINELVQNGLPWKGLISKEMILSIFWHDNPVHDGAVIINGDRIQEVGAILPLTHRTDIPSHYGTRHRAAIGLSEISDALIILVSEEKGAVLVAKDSRMATITRREKLESILLEHVGATSPAGQHPQKEKLKLSIAALLSLLLVTGIWYSFSRGLETLISLETPIDYMNRDPEMEILDTSINTVNLNISGSGPLIKSIRPDQVMVRVDLKNAAIGNNTFTITKENISLPPGVYLKSVKPATVEVVLDTPIRKRLPVQVDWTGKLSPELILVQAALDPPYVEMIGRNKILRDITTIYTKKVFLDTITKSGSLTVNLALSPASLKLAPGSKDKVTVSYVVEKRSQ
ncbi:MAG: diadenylate cyclase [Desulfobacterales bacterium]|nr:diadenylate cyclase [Desulfobacterales bacterium]